MRSFEWPPEPFAEFSGEFHCDNCEQDTDQDCVQYLREGPIEGACLSCGTRNEFELEWPDDN